MDITDKDFEEKVIEQSKTIPVLVDFWAPWCGPCRSLTPIIEKVCEEYKGKVILAKINVDENKVSASAYGVSSIPNVKLFKDGSPVAEFVGLVSEGTIKKMLDENL